MFTYLIGYDLNSPGQNYSQLIEAIKNVGVNGWCHCLDSTWIIKHTGTALSIRDALLPYIDKNDELFVVQLYREGSWWGFSEEASSWLTSNL